ncbi:MULTISPECIES: polysaccharide biosynthesis tyrosine autokinase [Chelatococcus]|uniref:non-specific protein-tyrosine kinase n=1 Tax=Chelatococcus caeni TaxID=1348468 RepID=A0A840C5I0_9HYPH|nr:MULTISPECIES: polysaccharide biosynthesis tyrosine autokinase [Chelatococcus]MBB4018709.1 exopolysaccharide transport family protein [Chelatococcus caeni]
MLKRSSSEGARLPAAPAGQAHGLAPADVLDLRGLWLVLRRRGGVVVTTVCLILALTILALVLIEPRYSATAVVLIDPRQQRVISAEAVLSGIGSDAAAVESQVEVIESPTLALRVIEREKLENDPEFARRGFLARVAEQLSIGRHASGHDEAALRRAAVLEALRERTRVKRRGLTYVLEITVTSQSPQKAARLANAVADEYLAGQLAAKYRATERASLWLGARLEELREQVRGAERAVEHYKAEHNLVSVGSGDNLLEQQIAEINQQMILARAKTAEARAKFAQIREAAGTGGGAPGIAEALGSLVVTNLRTQFAEAARRVAELGARYGGQHPSVTAARAQVDDLQQQIDAELARILSGVRNEYEVAVGREASLEASLAELKKEAARWGESTVRLRELEREAKALRSVYEQFLARSKETLEQQSLQIADAEIISPAMVPMRPSYPRTLLVLAVACAGSLLTGLSLAFAFEHLDPGFRSIEQVEAYLGLPCLGVLPLVEEQARPVQSEPRTAGPATSRSWLWAVDRPADALMRILVEQPLSAFAEAVRTVRVGLRFADRGRGVQVLVVVSALPGEGKSTIAANLALALKAAGERVVLVDGDLRNPALTRALTPHAEQGLIEVLRGEQPLETILVEDEATGLTFLPTVRAGAVANAAELIETGHFDTMLKRLRLAFDHVIVDAAPLLPVVDSRAIVARADGALLVVEWGRTDRAAVQEAMRTLADNADRVTGAVLSKATTDAYQYHYGIGGYGGADGEA